MFETYDELYINEYDAKFAIDVLKAILENREKLENGEINSFRFPNTGCYFCAWVGLCTNMNFSNMIAKHNQYETIQRIMLKEFVHFTTIYVDYPIDGTREIYSLAKKENTLYKNPKRFELAEHWKNVLESFFDPNKIFEFCGVKYKIKLV